MEFALAMRHIWRHRIWLVPVTVLSILGGLAVAYHTTVFPPSLKSKSYDYGAASAQLLVQPVRPAAFAELTATSAVPPEQVALYGALLQSQPLRRQIGREAGIPWPALAVEGQSLNEPGANQRSAQLVSGERSLSLFYSIEPGVPIINLYAQAPQAATAQRIVISASKSLKGYVQGLQTRSNTPPSQRMRVLGLGPPQGGTLAAGAGRSMGILVALLLFIGGCLLIVFVPRFVFALRRAGAIEESFGADVPIPAMPQSREAIEPNGNGAGREIGAAPKHLPEPD